MITCTCWHSHAAQQSTEQAHPRSHPPVATDYIRFLKDRVRHKLINLIYSLNKYIPLHPLGGCNKTNLSLAPCGSLAGPLWHSLALTGSLWLSVAHTLVPTGSLCLSLAHYYSENLLIQSLLGSQRRCHADAVSSGLHRYTSH